MLWPWGGCESGHCSSECSPSGVPSRALTWRHSFLALLCSSTRSAAHLKWACLHVFRGSLWSCVRRCQSRVMSGFRFIPGSICPAREAFDVGIHPGMEEPGRALLTRMCRHKASRWCCLNTGPDRYTWGILLKRRRVYPSCRLDSAFPIL